MGSETTFKPRRTLLMRGMAAAAAAVGLGAGHRPARAGTDTAPEPDLSTPAAGRTLRLYGRGRTVAMPAKGARSLRCFELLDGPDGAPVGEFFASGFQLETAFGPHPAAASNIELHTFRLGDDILFGIGAAAARGRERTHALLGGTGRFAGARGSYVESEVEGGVPGRGHVEFLVTLVG